MISPHRSGRWLTKALYAVPRAAFLTLTVSLVSFSQAVEGRGDFQRRLVPTIPQTVRAEVGEYIRCFSGLADGARWKVFPPELGTFFEGSFLGETIGTGWLVGTNGDSVSLVPVSVEELTPSDHDILVGLRSELRDHNLYRNHLLTTSEKHRLAVDTLGHIQVRYRDAEIKIRSKLSEGEKAYDELIERAGLLDSARLELLATIDDYLKAFTELPPLEWSFSRENPLILLPAGSTIGSLIICRGTFYLSQYEDWRALADYELENRAAISEYSLPIRVAAEKYDEEVEGTTSALFKYQEIMMDLSNERLSQTEILYSLLKLEAEIDVAGEKKLRSLFGKKAYDRKVREFKLWYQFRRWLESRTVVGKSERDGSFAVETGRFKSRLLAYREDLLVSLETIDSLVVAGQGDPRPPILNPNLFFLPELFPGLAFEMTSAGVARVDLAGSGAESILIRGLKKINLPFFSEPSREIHQEGKADVHSVTFHPPPVSGAHTASGVPIDEFNEGLFDELPPVDLVQEPEPILPPDTFLLEEFVPPPPSNSGGERNAVLKTYLSAFEEYVEDKTKVVEAGVALEYRGSVNHSLEVLDGILTYIDWRIEYIKLAHSGNLSRKMLLRIEESRWAELLGVEPIVLRETLGSVLYELKLGDADALIPSEIVDFIFGSEVQEPVDETVGVVGETRSEEN